MVLYAVIWTSMLRIYVSKKGRKIIKLVEIFTASTQRLLAISTGTSAIPEPEGSADSESLPPNKAAEPPIHQPPKQVPAPTRLGGPLELLLGEESQRVMGQRGLTLACTLEGQMPIEEAHGRPLDLPNLQRQGSIVWELVFVVPKAHVRTAQVQRPVPDEGAHTCPDLWPSLGIVTIDPDVYFGSAFQLEGEQNIHVPCVGSELHHIPLNIFHFHPHPLFLRHLTCSHARIRRERVLPPSGALLKTSAPNARNSLMHRQKTYMNQGEHWHRTTHLSSSEIQTLLDLPA